MAIQKNKTHKAWQTPARPGELKDALKKSPGKKSVKYKKPPAPTEFQIQCNIFSWAKVMEHQYPELKLLNASMNGAWIPNADPEIKGKGILKKFKWRIIALLKKCGCLRPGWPDINLPVPRGGYHGLFIELKRDDGGELSQEQADMIRELARQGNYACVCKGEAATKQIILKYLEGELRNVDL